MKTTILAVALLPALFAAAVNTATAPSPPKPIAGSMVTPIYPTEERENRVQGTVVLSVDVSAEGTVTNVQVDKPVAGHPAFSGAAIAAVRQWRFEPARSNGQPVAVTISVPVRFALE